MHSEAEDPGEASQAASLALLRGLRAADGAPAEEVVTHISRIFLVGDEALKIKRARTLPFLDFSAPQSRAQACRREVEVNHAAGDKIYLGVSAILPSGGDVGLRLGPIEPPQRVGADPNAVDWVVRMRRFDRAGELHRVAERGALDAPLIRRLADQIAAAQGVSPILRRSGWPGSLHAVIRNVARTLAASDHADEARDWAAQAEARLDALTPLLAARARHGFVRRLHGDLHLGNICLIGGEPVPFDAIEFSEEIATIDLLYDIAFTAMDLVDHGLRDLAAELTSRYLARSRDYRGLAAWPLFLSTRAGVRAMIAALGGEAQLATRRLSLATALLDKGRTPHRLIAIGGLSGTGKTTLARRLALEAPGPTGAVILSTDEVRKRLLGLPPEQPAPPEAYRPEVSDAVYRRQRIDAARALDAGASVILDGVYGRADGRAAAHALAAARGIRFDGLWLHLPKDQRLRRVGARQADRRSGRETGDSSDADLSVASAQKSPSRAAVEASAGWTWVGADKALDALVGDVFAGSADREAQ